MDSFITPETWAAISEEDRMAIAAAVRDDRLKRGDAVEKPIVIRHRFYVKFLKRCLDIVIGGLAFIVTFLVNVIIGIVTFFDVGSPIFFRQERIGKDGKPFTLTKFRNMTNETNEHGVLLRPEDRVTKWGSFVRKSSLDELLNFWSILKGDMSIIGPRPLTKKYYERFSAEHQQRHMVRPGLECPFHDTALAKEGWQGRFDNDIWYVENVSFATDIKMFFLLIKKTFSKKERIESATGRTGEFIGYHEDGSVMDEWTVPKEYLEVIKQRETTGV